MKIKKFQEGGTMPTQPTEASAAAQDPMQIIVDLFVTGLQNQDCQSLKQGAEAFLTLMQESQAAPQEQPVYKRGGKIKKMRKGC